MRDMRIDNIDAGRAFEQVAELANRGNAGAPGLHRSLPGRVPGALGHFVGSLCRACRRLAPAIGDAPGLFHPGHGVFASPPGIAFDLRKRRRVFLPRCFQRLLRECRVIGRAVSDCIRLIGVIPRAGRPFLGTASGVFGIGGRVDCALAGIGGHDPEAPERIGRGVKEDFYLARRAAIVVGIGNFLILRIKDERPAIAGDAQHVAAGIVFYPFRQRNDRAGLPGQFLGEVSVLVDAAVMQLAVVADARRGFLFSRRQ